MCHFCIAYMFSVFKFIIMLLFSNVNHWTTVFIYTPVDIDYAARAGVPTMLSLIMTTRLF